MSRPTAEERRLAYLRVGAELAMDFTREGRDSTLDALANVKVADVAVRAGVTKGALYHLWGSQDDYRRDLLRHIIALREERARAHADRLVADALRAHGDATDFVALATRIAVESYEDMRGDPGILARFSFYNYANDPLVNELLTAGTSGFEDYYQQFLDVTGRRMRAPFTMQNLVTAVNAFLIGSIVRYRIVDDHHDDVDDTDLYGRGFRAFLMHLTEPDPTADA